MKKIQSVTVKYRSATGEELTADRTLNCPVPGTSWGGPKVESIRIRWAGGAGGTFRLYAMRSDGILNAVHIPQESVISVETNYQKEAK